MESGNIVSDPEYVHDVTEGDDKAYFKDFNLHIKLLDSLTTVGYIHPTKIQEHTIPHALLGKDILASSHTGSGKTIAFCTPIMNAILTKTKNQVLILTPTRELALQIFSVLVVLSKEVPMIRSVVVFGGAPIVPQIRAIKQQKPNIIVATPGRLMDLVNREVIALPAIDMIILDEADRMLDMGFKTDIDIVFQKTSANRQTMMFTATLSKGISKIAHEYLKDPEQIAMQTRTEPIDIEQKFLFVEKEEKMNTLLQQINEHKEVPTIIFANTRSATEWIERTLKNAGHNAKCVHGDVKQTQREAILRKFRKQEFNIIIGTDVLGRGIDVSHIGLVINFDLPNGLEDYTHRIGRTGRQSGTKGIAISLYTKEDKAKYNIITNRVDVDSNDLNLKGGKKTGNRRFGSRDRFGSSRSDGGFRNRYDNNSSGERRFGNRDGDNHFRSDYSGDRKFGNRNSTYSTNPIDRERRFGNRDGDNHFRSDYSGDRKFGNRGNSERTGGSYVKKRYNED